MLGAALLLGILLLLSAFFSASEIAVFSLSEARIRVLQEEGRRGAGTLLALKERPERLLSTILVGNNLVNIGATSLATALALQLFGNNGIAVATGVMTLLVLVFGEITPKSFAARRADVFAPAIAPLLALLTRVFTPVVLPVEMLTRMVVGGSNGQTVTEGEIRELTAMGHRYGAIEEHERRIIERAFTLDDTLVADVMTPRVDVVAFPADRSVGEFAQELPNIRHTRVPVYDSGIDHVVGILYLREVYTALLAGQTERTLGSLAREPYLVPASLPLTRMLTEFQSRRVHMAIVVDEYGGTDGIVTLEDVLEELVGDILDETDLDAPMIVRLSEDELLVDGAAELRELNESFGTSFSLEEHRSVNGYLLDRLGHVPRAGETVQADGVRLRVVQATGTQVTRAHLVLLREQQAED